MNDLELAFFEEYRDVDNLCRDMYNSQQGVTEYIKLMEYYDYDGQNLVDGWTEKYKMLKRLRWLRNNIAHEGYSETTEDDLIELEHFHAQLMKVQDPLSEVLHYLRRMQHNHQAETQTIMTSPSYSSGNAKKRSSAMVKVGMIVAIVILILVVLMLVGVSFSYLFF